jgi:hypothetical protein
MSALLHSIKQQITVLYTRWRTQSADYCTQGSAINQLIYCTQDGAPEVAGTRGCARNTRGSKQVTRYKLNNKVLQDIFGGISVLGPYTERIDL